MFIIISDRFTNEKKKIMILIEMDKGVKWYFWKNLIVTKQIKLFSDTFKIFPSCSHINSIIIETILMKILIDNIHLSYNAILDSGEKCNFNLHQKSNENLKYK